MEDEYWDIFSIFDPQRPIYRQALVLVVRIVVPVPIRPVAKISEAKICLFSGLVLWMILSWGLSACSPRAMDQLFSRRPVGEIEYDCKPRGDDPEGLVLRVCAYLNDNQIWVGRNKGLEVTEIVAQERDGVDVLIVRFNCCGTGDFAVIDKETGEVLSYHFGIY